MDETQLPPDLMLAVKRRQEMENAAFNQWVIECSDVLEKLKHSLKGEIMNFETGEWEVEEGFEPFVNNAGINFLLVIVDSYMHKVNILSTFEQEEINDLIYDLKEELIDILTIRQVKYQIPEECVGIITSLIGDQVYGLYKRALGGAERKSRQTITSLVEQRIMSPDEMSEQKKPKLFGIIPRR